MQSRINRKTKPQPNRRLRNVTYMAAMACAMTASSVMAASQTWTGLGGDGLWSTGANWSGAAAPGAIVTLTQDVATFNGPVGAVSPISFPNQQNIGSFLFDTADAGAYTFQHAGWDPNNHAALG